MHDTWCTRTRGSYIAALLSAPSYSLVKCRDVIPGPPRLMRRRPGVLLGWMLDTAGCIYEVFDKHSAKSLILKDVAAECTVADGRTRTSWGQELKSWRTKGGLAQFQNHTDVLPSMDHGNGQGSSRAAKDGALIG